jgi:quinol monooxygenase YgiN
MKEGSMITVLFSMTVRAGREEEWRALLGELHRSTHAEDEGCLSYSFYRQADDPRRYVLHEQWRDADALNAHVARLQRVLGPPPRDEAYPPTHHRRRLPAAFLDFFERTEAVRYEVVA